MSNTPMYRPDLYVGTADSYDRYRPGYSAGLFDDLCSRAGIVRGGRLLDLACGTGQIIFALASRFDGVVAIDQEAEMVRFGSSKANDLGVGNIAWIEGRAEDVVLEGPFHLITIGNAFHRFNRQLVAERVRTWLAPGGYLALLWNDTPWCGPAAWQRVLNDTMQEWARRVDATERAPAGWELALDRDPHANVLERAGLRNVGRYVFPVDRTWSVETLLGFMHSTSTHSRAALGEDAAAFERELAGLLLEVEPKGMFEEHSSCAYDLATYR